MKIVVVDGQGGRLGKMLVEQIKNTMPGEEVIAVGTNSIATAAMLKAGADSGATGENPVSVVCRKADVIMGPIGIVMADALLGEITPKMAAEISKSDAHKVLIPMNRCNTEIAGTAEMSMSEYVKLAVEKVYRLKVL